MAEVALTKQAAAHRLIMAAALMDKNAVDPLATHVVAASALNLLRELVQTRGPSYQTRVLQTGLFETATAQIERRNSLFFTDASEEMNAVIEYVKAAILDGSISQPSDLDIVLDSHQERALLKSVNDPYNFLKHADRDPLSTLDESDADPTNALMHAVTAYSMLFPAEALPDEVKDFLLRTGIVGS